MVHDAADRRGTKSHESKGIEEVQAMSRWSVSSAKNRREKYLKSYSINVLRNRRFDSVRIYFCKILCNRSLSKNIFYFLPLVSKASTLRNWNERVLHIALRHDYCLITLSQLDGEKCAFAFSTFALIICMRQSIMANGFKNASQCPGRCRINFYNAMPASDIGHRHQFRSFIFPPHLRSCVNFESAISISIHSLCLMPFTMSLR